MLFTVEYRLLFTAEYLRKRDLKQVSVVKIILVAQPVLRSNLDNGMWMIQLIAFVLVGTKNEAAIAANIARNDVY